LRNKNITEKLDANREGLSEVLLPLLEVSAMVYVLGVDPLVLVYHLMCYRGKQECFGWDFSAYGYHTVLRSLVTLTETPCAIHRTHDEPGWSWQDVLKCS